MDAIDIQNSRMVCDNDDRLFYYNNGNAGTVGEK